MDRNFQRAFSLVLKHEGGWADNPADPGGPTMKGVTLATFRKYVKPGATKDDLRKITDAQLAMVYRRHYWHVVAGAELPDGVDYAVFDFAVNSGPRRAATYLQAVVGAAQDGKIGPETLKATRAKLHATVINQLCDDRLAFLKRAKDKKGKLLWPTFGRGWEPRVKGVRRAALDMAARPSAPEPAPQPVQPAPVPVPVPQTAPTPPPGRDLPSPGFDFLAWLLSRFRH
ncbi:glycoside hydrolase family 108 protein [Mesorhizobium yinganensis]|uniref:glycoside hydrolase family 108 protein n=1 Tax=Mesorhizobium yinganensis TaxID=3157707 RepID=UPI0032B77A93